MAPLPGGAHIPGGTSRFGRVRRAVAGRLQSVSSSLNLAVASLRQGEQPTAGAPRWGSQSARVCTSLSDLIRPVPLQDCKRAEGDSTRGKTLLGSRARRSGCASQSRGCGRG